MPEQIEIDPHTTWVSVNYTCATCSGTGRVQLGTPGTMLTPSRCDACGGGGIRTAPLTLENLRKFLLEEPTPAPAAPAAPIAAPETVELPALDNVVLYTANASPDGTAV